MEVGAGWLADQLKANVSQTVTYWRCNKSIPNLKATLGQNPPGIQDEGTAIETHWQSQDWLIKPGDLVLDGQTITPEQGDRIEWNDNIYEVLQTFEPPKRKSGPHGYMLRIHTKLIAC